MTVDSSVTILAGSVASSCAACTRRNITSFVTRRGVACQPCLAHLAWYWTWTTKVRVLGPTAGDQRR